MRVRRLPLSEPGRRPAVRDGGRPGTAAADPGTERGIGVGGRRTSRSG